ncbi:Proteasome subunit alpha type-4 [Cardamine amara subsp. amara]|uniref:Proteasome subunit alpha type-4 n=1 Tax=Cardamine amara subsp. amara TaxID=228776 RepID=A0ABD0ZSH6_CARAN
MLTHSSTRLQSKLNVTPREPIGQLVQSLCDTKQFVGLRPFGVSFLFAGWDKNYGFQLYMSEPSGNYGGWKAAAIGANNQAGKRGSSLP